MSFLERHLVAIRIIVRMVGGRICRDRGWDVEDLEGDVMVALLRKQASPRSRFDPRRAPLDFYVRTVVRSVVGHWMARDVVRTRAFEDDIVSDEAVVDERGVNDEQLGRLSSVLVDARRALTPSRDIAYRTLVAWLELEHDVDTLAEATGVDRLELLRYLQLTLAVLRRRASPEWRPVWSRHWERVKRAKRNHLRAVGEGPAVGRGPPPPLGRPPGPRGG